MILLPLHEGMTVIESLHAWITTLYIGVLAMAITINIIFIRVFWPDFVKIYNTLRGKGGEAR